MLVTLLGGGERARWLTWSKQSFVVRNDLLGCSAVLRMTLRTDERYVPASSTLLLLR